MAKPALWQTPSAYVGLSNNDIDWTKQEFNKELKVLEYLPELRTITLMENPFCATIHDYNGVFTEGNH